MMPGRIQCREPKPGTLAPCVVEAIGIPLAVAVEVLATRH